MDEQFSSRWTFFMKFVFSTIWILSFGAGTAALFVGTLRGKHGAPTPWQIKWLFLTIWTVGSATILYQVSRLKRVWIKGDVLYISNYFRELGVPISELTEVVEHRFQRGNPITLRFARDFGFGREVTLLPKMSLKFQRQNPVAARLKALIDRGH